MTRQTAPQYQSFLLRCWQAEGDKPEWRFALRDVSADPREHNFGDLDGLVAYLQTMTTTGFKNERIDANENQSVYSPNPL